MDLSFFDCFCSVGKTMAKKEWEYWDKKSLLNKMDRYGIEKALVYNSISKEYNPKLGNQELLKICDNRLIPMWTLLPYVGNEFYDEDSLRKEIVANHISCATLFPTEHNYSFSTWNLKSTLSLLEEMQIPLFIDAVNFNEINNVLSEFSKLNIVVRNVGYRSDRMLIPLMKQFSNLHVQSMGYKVFFGIENLVEIFGAKRVLFGSGMPVVSGGGAVFQILQSALNERDKELIASKNLEELLGKVVYGRGA